ncbi:MAG: hypothetical protein ABIH38_04045 [Patescibacteria group bacterium]
MTFIYSFFLSLAVVIILSLFFREEAGFWREKITRRFRRKNKPVNEIESPAAKPIEKFCGFRDWSENGGEMCTIFQLEDGREYQVSENICRQCQVWNRYQTWLDSGKKENLSVTLTHTFRGSQPMVVETDKLNPEMDKGLTFNDFVIKRRHFPWAGKAVIAFFTLVTYLIVYFSGVFTNPVVFAMPDTFYFYDVGDKATADAWNMRTTDPASAADIDTKCTTTDTESSDLYCVLDSGDTNSTFASLPLGLTGKGWMTDNDSLLNGTIPAGDYTVKVQYVWTETSLCDYMESTLYWRLYKASSDLTSPTSIINNNFLCDLTKTGVRTCTDTVPVLGDITFNNEVLYVEFFWYISFICSKSPAPAAILSFHVDEGGSGERLDTPTYAPVPENSFYFAFAVPFIPLIIKRFRLRDYIKKLK